MTFVTLCALLLWSCVLAGWSAQWNYYLPPAECCVLCCFCSSRFHPDSSDQKIWLLFFGVRSLLLGQQNGLQFTTKRKPVMTEPPSRGVYSQSRSSKVFTNQNNHLLCLSKINRFLSGGGISIPTHVRIRGPWGDICVRHLGHISNIF